jgi:RNA polymerase sigma-70 factor (ECF subfamily)
MSALSTTRVSLSEEDVPDFETLYADHFHDVVRWARALGGPDTDLEDISQEVFIVVRRKLTAVAFEGGSAKAWLYRITANTVSDYRRRAWFRNFFSGGRNEELDGIVDAKEGPLVGVVRKDARRVIFQLAKQIHKTRRDTFLLFELEGLSGEEIAEVQKLPVATVWTRLHLARKEFMAAVADFRQREGL